MTQYPHDNQLYRTRTRAAYGGRASAPLRVSPPLGRFAAPRVRVLHSSHPYNKQHRRCRQNGGYAAKRLSAVGASADAAAQLPPLFGRVVSRLFRRPRLIGWPSPFCVRLLWLILCRRTGRKKGDWPLFLRKYPSLAAAIGLRTARCTSQVRVKIYAAGRPRDVLSLRAQRRPRPGH